MIFHVFSIIDPLQNLLSFRSGSAGWMRVSLLVESRIHVSFSDGKTLTVSPSCLTVVMMYLLGLCRTQREGGFYLCYPPVGSCWTGSGLAAEGHFAFSEAFWVNDSAWLFFKHRAAVMTRHAHIPTWKKHN